MLHFRSACSISPPLSPPRRSTVYDVRNHRETSLVVLLFSAIVVLLTVSFLSLFLVSCSCLILDDVQHVGNIGKMSVFVFNRLRILVSSRLTIKRVG